MDTHADRADETTKMSPVYVVRNGEMMLDAPLQQVWHHMINYPSWQNYSIVQNISGDHGQEGEIVLLKKEEAGLPSAPFYARTIKLEPGRRVIWKTYRDSADFFGIVEFKLCEAERNTRFCYNLLYEHLIAYTNEIEMEAFRQQQYENVDKLFSIILPKLKQLVEKKGA